MVGSVFSSTKSHCHFASTVDVKDQLAKFWEMEELCETKLHRDPNLFQGYKDFLDEYENLSHMTKVAKSSGDTNLRYFLPHHAVVRDIDDQDTVHSHILCAKAKVHYLL